MPRAARRAFSLVEMLIALAISGALLSATLVALDTTFKGYEVNADSASSHVVTRIAVNRIMGLVRTGADFGPMPGDVLDNAQNPMVADYFEFVSERDGAGDPVTLTRIEYRYDGAGALYRSWGVSQTPPALGFEPTGPGELHLVQIDADTGAETSFLLLERVRSVRFVLSYDVGPRLERCTMDITVEPAIPEDLKLESDAPPQTVRLVASAMPRRIVE
jgi:prepilin-type N-terminal cleavage/methylation domain-containing protein